MNTILQIFEFVGKRRWIVFLAGAVLGLLLGLAVGWWWLPVEVVNSPLSNLRADFRDNYLLWVAEQYEHQHASNPEWARIMLLGKDYNSDARKATLKDNVEEATSMLNDLAQACESGGGTYATCSGEDAQRLRSVMTNLQMIDLSSAGGGPSILSIVVPICLALLVLFGVVVGGLFIYARLRSRGGESKEKRGAMAERMYPAEPAYWGPEGPPLAQFPTTYTLGDDHYDPSFSVELESGEFMGECGVGVSETVGVGAPNKITAFEVWLFDKSDIRTVTKVLMSEYAFNDEALRAKLAPKGEPVLSQEGQEIVLETKTLRVRARVVECKYGIGNLPPNSFFERLSIDLVAWATSVPGGGEPLLGGDDLDFVSSIG
jgi:hypothetical protein